MDYLDVACTRLSVSPDRVLVCRVEGDDLVVVVDRGVAGCPKYRLRLADLVPPVVKSTEQDKRLAASMRGVIESSVEPNPRLRGRRKRNG
jgi:hypothetical protein